MSDIRFEGWLHRSGTGGVYQDSAGNVGIASTQPQTRLDIGNGGFQVGPTGIATVTTVNTTNLINATPLSNRRVNINGCMQIWQRSDNATDIGGSNGYFACDRYRSSNNGSQRHSIIQSSDTPNGFGYSMKIDVTTANSSPSANNYVFIQHRLEGHDLQQFAKGSSDAKQYTLSFHVKSPKTGVHVVQWEDVQNTRSTSKSYTVSQANTWEKHTITFDADTTGVISNDITHRMQLYFWLMAGSTYNTGNVSDLATTWAGTGAASRASGQVNCFDSTDNDFYITGIQLEVGSVATPFEHRSYGDEFSRCGRYYQKIAEGNSKAIALCFHYSTTYSDWVLQYPMGAMRTNPSIDMVQGSNYYYLHGGTENVYLDGAFIIEHGQVTQSNVYFDPDGGLTAGGTGYLKSNNNSAYLAISAEL